MEEGMTKRQSTHWHQLGNIGWGWDDVLPYFLKSEDHHGGDSAMHRAGGPWKVAKQCFSL